MGTTSTFTNPLLVAVDEAQKRSDRARRAYAVAKNRKMSWQAYARMLTRNSKLRVELTGGTPCTDGETIWLRVPIELGDELDHNKKLCGQRHALTKRMLCEACDIFDGIDCTQYHETSHITADSFQSFPEHEIVNLLHEAIRLEAEGLPESTRAVKLKKKFEATRPYNFIMAANLISPWLGVLLNAVEDARVNETMRQARPGTALMFQAQTNKIFEEGIEQVDGTRMRWDGQPLNMQAVIGVYCKVSSLDYSTWLAPEVCEALNDPEIIEITLRARTARSVGNAFRMSIRFLEALRRLGFCLADDDVEDDPKPEGEPGESKPEKGEDDGEGGSGSGSGGSDTEPAPGGDPSGGSGGSPEPSEPDTDSDSDEAGSGDTADDEADVDSSGKGDESGEPDSSESDKTGESDSTSGKGSSDSSDEDWDGSNPEHIDSGELESAPLPMGDPGDAERGLAIFGRHNEDGSVDTGTDPEDEEELNRAIQQADYFDAPSEAVFGVNVHTDPSSGEGKAWRDNGYSYSSHDPIVIPETILSPALLRLRRLFQANKRGSYERDRKNGAVDGRVLGKRVLSDDYRWFKAKRQPGKRDYFVLIGLDVSGSTSRPGIIDLIKTAAFAKAELCQRLGVKFAIYAHTGVYEGGKGLMLDLYEIKSPKDRWDGRSKERLFKLRPAAANLDGHTLEHYRKIAQRETATDKLILYYTDGALPAENFDEELEILKREIDTVRRLGIKLVAVAVKNDDPLKYGLDTIRIDKIQDVPKVVEGLEKRLS